MNIQFNIIQPGKTVMVISARQMKRLVRLSELLSSDQAAQFQRDMDQALERNLQEYESIAFSQEHEKRMQRLREERQC